MEFAIGPNTKVRKLWFDQNPERIPGAPLRTIVVNKPMEFNKCYDAYLSPEKAGTIFGFDCEWICAENQERFAREGRENWPSLEALERVSPSLRHTAEHGKVSLVQISTFSGVTLLCRVCLWDAPPKKFVELIQNPNILKIGFDLAVSDSVKLYKSFGVVLRGTVHLGDFTGHPHFHDSWSSKGGLKAIIHRLFDLEEKFRELNIDEDIRWKSNWNGLELTDRQLVENSRRGFWKSFTPSTTNLIFLFRGAFHWREFRYLDISNPEGVMVVGAQKFYAAVDSQAALDAFLHLAPIVRDIWPLSVMKPVGALLPETGAVISWLDGKYQEQWLPVCVDYEYRDTPKEVVLDFYTMPLETCTTIYEACSGVIEVKPVLDHVSSRKGKKSKQPKRPKVEREWDGQPITSSSSEDSDSDSYKAAFCETAPTKAVASGKAVASARVPTFSQEFKKETMEISTNSANGNGRNKQQVNERFERLMESYGVGARSFYHYSRDDVEDFEESSVRRKTTVRIAVCESSATHAVNSGDGFAEQPSMRPNSQGNRDVCARSKAPQAQMKLELWQHKRPLHAVEFRSRGFDKQRMPGWDVPVGSVSKTVPVSDHGSRPSPVTPPRPAQPKFPSSTFVFPLPPIDSNPFRANTSPPAISRGFEVYRRHPPRQFRPSSLSMRRNGFASAGGQMSIYDDEKVPQGSTSPDLGGRSAGYYNQVNRGSSTFSHDKQESVVWNSSSLGLRFSAPEFVLPTINFPHSPQRPSPGPVRTMTNFSAAKSPSMRMTNGFAFHSRPPPHRVPPFRPPEAQMGLSPRRRFPSDPLRFPPPFFGPAPSLRSSPSVAAGGPDGYHSPQPLHQAFSPPRFGDYHYNRFNHSRGGAVLQSPARGGSGGGRFAGSHWHRRRGGFLNQLAKKREWHSAADDASGQEKVTDECLAEKMNGLML